MVCGIPQFRTEIRNSQNNNVLPELYGAHLTFLIYYVVVVVMFLLNCLSDKQPLETKYSNMGKVRQIKFKFYVYSIYILIVKDYLFVFVMTSF